MQTPDSTSTVNATETDAGGSPQRQRRLLAKGKRLSGYFFWYMLGILIDLALPQLVMFPLAMYWMGPDDFGVFLYAFGIVNLVGMSPSTGLVNTLMRNYASVSDDRKPLVLRTAFVMEAALAALLAVAVIAVCLVTGWMGAVETLVAAWVALLALMFAARNVVTVGMADLSVSRDFARRTIWQNAGNTLALIGLVVLGLSRLSADESVHAIGNWSLPLGFAVGHIAALVLQMAKRRGIVVGRPQFDAAIARRLWPMWTLLSINALFFLSSRYVHRTVLGFIQVESFEAVSAYFAAVAILNLFLIPLNIVGLFAYQLLAAHKSRQRFSLKLLRLYAVGVWPACGVFCAITYWLCEWPLKWLYPKVAAHSVEPMLIMLPGLSLTILMFATRGFVLKFSSRRRLVLVAIVSLICHVGSALVLIPWLGTNGAAWSYSIGSAAVGLTWYGCFVFGFLFHPPSEDEGEASIDNLDTV